ncbi:SLC13 family permease [Citricoccus sp. K5]|uniref:SLC13 family permease n=1 Tax=Citricoccus sp. K5 TaxID=2653135 RepID=UPI0012F2C541|nr:SLC13 family permease [Citricoccus sp. K5]VXB63946.1 Transporter [Citricoccus sp. K5]
MTSITAPAPATGVVAAGTIRALVLVSAMLAAWFATAGWMLDQRLVVVALAVATAAWMATRVDDTVVALVAVVALALTGAIPTESVFGALGHPTIWLLIGSCMIAAGLTSSGVAERAAEKVVGRARSLRGLWYRTTLALILTSFAVPATSGRAALTMPIFRTVAGSLPKQHQVALSLLFPAVILLSAFASILGAGAHLIAAGLIESATGTRISFAWWVVLGAPVAVASSFAASELILLRFLSRDDRRIDVAPVAAALTARSRHGKLAPAEFRALAILGVVITLWLTEPLHGLDPALVAVTGGAAAVLPGIGAVTSKQAFVEVPWPLLIFLATTIALGTALVETGAADRVADASLGLLSDSRPALVLLAIVAVSALAHLAVQSRSARSTVLLPIVLVIAAGAGINPVAAALASTAAAGFCLTLTSSAKPVTMFSDVPGIATFTRNHLLILAAMIGPIVVGFILLAAVWLWPLLGVPLMNPVGTS